MSDEALKRRVQRLFQTLVIGGAAFAAQACDDGTTEPHDHDSGHVDVDGGDDTDGGNGAQFW